MYKLFRTEVIYWNEKLLLCLQKLILKDVSQIIQTSIMFIYFVNVLFHGIFLSCLLQNMCSNMYLMCSIRYILSDFTSKYCQNGIPFLQSKIFLCYESCIKQACIYRVKCNYFRVTLNVLKITFHMFVVRFCLLKIKCCMFWVKCHVLNMIFLLW